MTVIAAGAQRKARNLAGKRIYEITVGTSSTILKGALVSLKASTQRVINATKSTATLSKCIGVAEDTVTQSASSTKKIKIGAGYEALFSVATSMSSYVGCNAGVVDNNTVTRLSSISTAKIIRVGMVTEIDGGAAWVLLGVHSAVQV